MEFLKDNAGVSAELIWQGFARVTDRDNKEGGTLMNDPALVSVIHINGCGKPMDVISILTVRTENNRRKFSRGCLYGTVSGLEDGFAIETYNETIKFKGAEDDIPDKDKVQLLGFSLTSNMVVSEPIIRCDKYK